MAERTLRGSRLGAVSYETDRNTEFVARQEREYICPQGHTFSVPFAIDVEIPPMWECRLHGVVATVADGEDSDEKKARPTRTHWDMLRERRTDEELEEVLGERLAFVRARRGETDK